jgi:hypothetical protein
MHGKRILALLAIMLVPFALSQGPTSYAAQTPTQNRCDATASTTAQTSHRPSFVLVNQYPEPVITIHSPGAEDIKYGFEDGRVVKIDNTYHLITTEMFADPWAVKTRIGYWTSEDRIHWSRISTLLSPSSGEQTGTDPRAALWGPMPVFDEQKNRWDLFYVGYRSKPDTQPQWLLNYEGRIFLALSQNQGLHGIAGPYHDVGIVLEPGPQSDSWEGLQGTDSFFAYPVKDKWYAIYGSAHTEKHPVTTWPVGLASAPSSSGPWKRCTELNPLPIEKVFSENPVVSRLDDGSFAAVYDTDAANAIGLTWSADGVRWEAGEEIVVQPNGAGKWADDVRTPLGLVPEGNNTFTVFYTGGHKPKPTKAEMWSVGFVTLKLKQAK